MRKKITTFLLLIFITTNLFSCNEDKQSLNKVFSNTNSYLNINESIDGSSYYIKNHDLALIRSAPYLSLISNIDGKVPDGEKLSLWLDSFSLSRYIYENNELNAIILKSYIKIVDLIDYEISESDKLTIHMGIKEIEDYLNNYKSSNMSRNQVADFLDHLETLILIMKSDATEYTIDKSIKDKLLLISNIKSCETEVDYLNWSRIIQVSHDLELKLAQGDTLKSIFLDYYHNLDDINAILLINHIKASEILSFESSQFDLNVYVDDIKILMDSNGLVKFDLTHDVGDYVTTELFIKYLLQIEEIDIEKRLSLVSLKPHPTGILTPTYSKIELIGETLYTEKIKALTSSGNNGRSLNAFIEHLKDKFSLMNPEEKNLYFLLVDVYDNFQEIDIENLKFFLEEQIENSVTSEILYWVELLIIANKNDLEISELTVNHIKRNLKEMIKEINTYDANSQAYLTTNCIILNELYNLDLNINYNSLVDVFNEVDTNETKIYLIQILWESNILSKRELNNLYEIDDNDLLIVELLEMRKGDIHIYDLYSKLFVISLLQPD